jgi:hypothetical protein|tara:strand:- start:1246 stop:1584 length:339 start_codon:yes stop_codon:yes gene_type:complete
MEDYIMTSIETDEQFVDNASDTYMSDEEREYWIDKEESHEEVEIEPCDDTSIDNAFNSLFGKKIKETKSIRRANKKALVEKVPNFPSSNLVVNRQEQLAERLANHFNNSGVK